jgi:peptidyl-prolyl cis-trans isomerase SurA
MTPRALALVLACAAALPAGAQLRPSPPAGAPAAPAADARPRAADTRPRPADYIVAVVNSEPVTNNEVRARLVRFEQQLAQQGGRPPSRGELTRAVLEQLIGEKAQLQLAREGGIKVDEGMVDAAEQNFARQNQMSVAELRRRLTQEGVASASFREDLRNQLLLSRLREREVDQRVKVTEQDIDQFLQEQQQAAAGAPSDLNLAHILVALPDNPNEQQVREAQAKAQRVLERARAGEDFARLARELSDAPGAAATGGVIGLRSADRYPPLFVDAVQSVPVGGVSNVLRSGAGFHVLKVVEKKQGGMPGASVTQHRARHILLRPSPQLTEATARARLAEFKQRIQAGQADFAKLAAEHSQDASAPRGGELGWANPGMFVPEFEEVLVALAPGQVSDPVTSRFGVHLIQLQERRVATLSPREQRDMVRGAVREKMIDEAYLKWAQDVRSRAFVEFREPPL